MDRVIATGPAPLGRGALIGQAIGDRVGSSYDAARKSAMDAAQYNPVREALLSQLSGVGNNPAQTMLRGLAENPEAFAAVMQDPNRMSAFAAGGEMAMPVAPPAAKAPTETEEMMMAFEQSQAARDAGDTPRADILLDRAISMSGKTKDDMDRVLELLLAAGIDPESPEGSKTIVDYLTGRGTTITNVMPGDNSDKATDAYGTGVGQAAVDTNATARAARGAIRDLERVEEALDAGAKTGKGQAWLLGMKNIAQSLFGVELGPDAAEQEVVQAIQAKLMTSFRSTQDGGGLPGSTSNKDLELMASATVGLGRTPAGNRALIKYLKAYHQAQIAVAREQQRLIAEAGGRVPPDLDMLLGDFLDAQQLISDDDRAEYQALRGGGFAQPSGDDDVVAKARAYLQPGAQ